MKEFGLSQNSIGNEAVHPQFVNSKYLLTIYQYFLSHYNHKKKRWRSRQSFNNTASQRVCTVKQLKIIPIYLRLPRGLRAQDAQKYCPILLFV